MLLAAYLEMFHGSILLNCSLRGCIIAGNAATHVILTTTCVSSCFCLLSLSFVAIPYQPLSLLLKVLA